MSNASPRWGAPRIHGELLKSESTSVKPAATQISLRPHASCPAFRHHSSASRRIRSTERARFCNGLFVVRTLLDRGGLQPAGTGRTQPLIVMAQRRNVAPAVSLGLWERARYDSWAFQAAELVAQIFDVHSRSYFD